MKSATSPKKKGGGGGLLGQESRIAHLRRPLMNHIYQCLSIPASPDTHTRARAHAQLIPAQVQ